MSTPSRAQYLRLKQLFHDALLLFRLGDFYELYDADACLAARELGVPLGMREFAEGECIPLCPLPYHSVERPITRLVACGHEVAIAEQIGNLRATKGLVEREVVRVVTPASAMAARRHPLSGCDSGPAGAEPDRSGRSPIRRGLAAPCTIASATVSVTAPIPTADGGWEERTAAPAEQLAFFDLLPMGADDRRR